MGGSPLFIAVINDEQVPTTAKPSRFCTHFWFRLLDCPHFGWGNIPLPPSGTFGGDDIGRDGFVRETDCFLVGIGSIP